MLGMTPTKDVKLGTIELKVKPYPEEKVLPEDGLYRYLYNPGKLKDDNRRHATDMIWSWNTFRLDRIVQNPGQRMNCLNGFRTESARDKHYKYCSSHGKVIVRMPAEKDNWLKFQDG